MARQREQIMLCYPYEEKRLTKWLTEVSSVFVQPKYEGDRCRAVIDEKGHVTLFSSSARVIESVPHINQALESYYHTSRNLNGKSLEFDGELYTHGMPHEEIRSRVSRTIGRHPDYEEIHYYIYDIMSLHIQRARTYLLHHYLGDPSELDFPIRVAPTFEVHNDVELELQYKRILELGYEGIVLRHPSNTYERKRSTLLMKLKPRLSGIYEVVDQIEEVTIQGEPKKALGALVLKDQDGGIFKVGSGFTRSQRIDYWQLNLKGRKVKIRYQDLTLGGAGIPKMASFETFVADEQTET